MYCEHMKSTLKVNLTLRLTFFCWTTASHLLCITVHKCRYLGFLEQRSKQGMTFTLVKVSVVVKIFPWLKIVETSLFFYFPLFYRHHNLKESKVKNKLV